MFDRLLIGVATLLLGGLAIASETNPEILVVVGAAGGDEYEKAFQEAAQVWQTATQRAGAELTVVGIDATDSSDRDEVRSWIEQRVDSSDRPVWLVLIGHGTFAREVAKFNLRGPDLSASELLQWLVPVTRPLVVVNGASASAPFINRLSGRGRVIVTATKTGTEQNYARFGERFATAIASMDSDLDHDDEVSIQEAFLKASAEVQAFYDSKDRIATEHAIIDDNGDGRGTPATMFRGSRAIADAKDAAAIDGDVASKMTWSPEGSSLAWLPDQTKRRAEIERKIDSLRSEKSALDEDVYFERLEPLMVDLARLYREVESQANEKAVESDEMNPVNGREASDDATK